MLAHARCSLTRSLHSDPVPFYLLAFRIRLALIRHRWVLQSRVIALGRLVRPAAKLCTLLTFKSELIAQRGDLRSISFVRRHKVLTLLFSWISVRLRKRLAVAVSSVWSWKVQKISKRWRMVWLESGNRLATRTSILSGTSWVSGLNLSRLNVGHEIISLLSVLDRSPAPARLESVCSQPVSLSLSLSLSQ